MSRPVHKIVNEANQILLSAIEKEDPTHIYAMFSGGHDSLCATKIASFSNRFNGVLHLNTGIGVPQTREYVRRLCDKNDWQLFEKKPSKKTYDELIMEKGFPSGPQSHNSMYFYLKQNQMQEFIQERKKYWSDRVGLVTGIREQESSRRMEKSISKETRRHGCQYWINPILYWSKIECNHFIDTFNLPRNPVVDVLHKSGECLCGAFADPNEIKELEEWYPETAKRIHKLEERAYQANLVDHKWGISQAPGKTWDDVELEDIDLTLCHDCPIS